MRKERGRKQAVHFSLRSEGKRGDNVQTNKRLLRNQRQCGIAIHPLLLGQELMGLRLKKKSLSKKFQRKKVLGNTVSGKGW